MSTCAFRNGFALLLVGLCLGCGSGGARAKPTDSDPTGSDDPSASNVLRSPKLDLPAPPAASVGLAPEFAAVCRDGYAGDPTRPAFDPTRSGPHRLLFIAADGSADALNNIVPEEWRPQAAAEVELVGCVGAIEKRESEVCHFLGTSRTLARQRHSLSARIVSPRSGASQLSVTQGPEPASCPDSTSSWDDRVGALPDPAQIASDIVDRFVTVPDCGRTRPFASCLQCWRDAQEAWPSSGCGGPVIDGHEKLPPVRTGATVALTWKWETFTSALFQPGAGFDWSESPDAPSLSQTTGPETSFVPESARAYSFLAQARMPDTQAGQVAQTRTVAVEARDRPVVQDVLGLTSAGVARVGSQGRFHVTVSGRPQGGYFEESWRWTWLDRPNGSTVGDPSYERTSSFWSFVPDVLGTYRMQVEYNDGVGFSEPAISEPITVIAGPQVSGLSDQQASVGVPFRIEGHATFAVGYPAFHWRLTSVPDGSALTENYFASVDSNSISLVADVAGAYSFEVVVSDNTGQSEPVVFTVTAS